MGTLVGFADQIYEAYNKAQTALNAIFDSTGTEQGDVPTEDPTESPVLAVETVFELLRSTATRLSVATSEIAIYAGMTMGI